MSSLLAAAHEMAGLGLQLFPLHYPVPRDGRLWCSCGNRECKNPAKHPYAELAPRGLLNATGEATVIERWWGGRRPFNIGIATGEVSGIVGVDVDPRHGGDVALFEREKRFGALPPTWRFLTGGGGEHIVFRHPGRRIPNSSSAVGDGIDVRGDGGYIVGPGSRHISGNYYAISVDRHPDDVGLADVPAWLLTLMMSSSSRSNGSTAPALPESWRKLVAEGVSEGRRNTALARLTGHLLGKGVDPLVVLDLARLWNQGRCKPPLADSEVVRTVDSISKRAFDSEANGDGW